MKKVLDPLNNKADFRLLNRIDDIMLKLVLMRDEGETYNTLQGVAGVKSRKIVEMVINHIHSTFIKNE